MSRASERAAAHHPHGALVMDLFCALNDGDYIGADDADFLEDLARRLWELGWRPAALSAETIVRGLVTAWEELAGWGVIGAPELTAARAWLAAESGREPKAAPIEAVPAMMSPMSPTWP